MSNSPLVSYTKISPNKSSPRNHAIDTITIHCFVGQASVESAGSWFSTPVAQCSCNYMIGADGRIALIVDEGDRSWCSSNAENDNRAVTIECASDKTAPYAVNKNVYASLIALCADICRRNDINALLWKGDKSLIGQVDKQNMTVHRWFKNKECPGEYLYSRHGQIAEEVNARLNGGTAAAPALIPVRNIAEKQIWDKLKSFGLNNYAVAGVMGNLFAESGLKPNNLQNTFNTRLCITDEEYTAAVDNGSYPHFVDDKAGYGLVQWTFWSRKKALLEYARKKKTSVADLDMQLEFFWQEIQGYRSVMDILNHAASVLEASNAVLHGYEQPADQSATMEKKRAAYGQGYYDKYASLPEITAKAGWVHEDDGWRYYLDAQHCVCSDWYQDNDKWYYFDAAGKMVESAWQQYKDNWYYLGTGGIMATGLQELDGKWYYFDQDGRMATKPVTLTPDKNGALQYPELVK